MISRRMLFTLMIGSACALGALQVSVAKNAHHNNGHNLLGAKLNHDGKHEVAKVGNNPVTAEEYSTVPPCGPTISRSPVKGTDAPAFLSGAAAALARSV